jgi:hypothetical protein
MNNGNVDSLQYLENGNLLTTYSKYLDSTFLETTDSAQ